MLYSVDAGKYVTSIPVKYKKEYEMWMKNLSSSDYQGIIDELNSRIDGSDINTSSWMPGNNWTGTVFDPIFIACGRNKVNSGFFFGLILFDLMIKREDVWGFGKYKKNGITIRGITYFLLQSPPAYNHT